MPSVVNTFLQTDLDDETRNLISSHVREIRVKKGEILQQNGDTDIKAYFIVEGLLRTYTLDEKGKEHIFIFAPEGWIASDIESSTQDQPATLFIDAIEDSTVEVIAPKVFEILMEKSVDRLSHEVPRLLRRISVLQRRVIMLMSASAQERYEAFLEKYPQLPQRVPQRMIASYLGMTPEALSKIRGDMARGQNSFLNLD